MLYVGNGFKCGLPTRVSAGKVTYLFFGSHRAGVGFHANGTRVNGPIELR